MFKCREITKKNKKRLAVLCYEYNRYIPIYLFDSYLLDYIENNKENLFHFIRNKEQANF
jgi:hypothetical protein